MSSTEDSRSTWSTSCITEIKVSYAWTIKNFSCYRKDPGESLESPTFDAANGSMWSLFLYPNGNNNDARGYISLYLKLCSSKKRGGEEVTFKLSYENEQEPWHRDHLASNRGKFQKGDNWGHAKLLKRDSYAICNMISRDDKFTVFCDILFLEERIEIDTPSQSDDAPCMHQMFQLPEVRQSDGDLESMFNKFGDVTIEADGKELLAYRGILQVRSPVFAAMFEHEMTEQKHNRVVITDIEHSVLREMLIYIYTGRSPNLKDMARNLFIVADKYDLESLKIMSEKVLCAQLTIENVIEILMLSDLHNCDQLKKCVINFITANSFHFRKLPVWENTVSVLIHEQPNLVIEVSKAVFALTK